MSFPFLTTITALNFGSGLGLSCGDSTGPFQSRATLPLANPFNLHEKNSISPICSRPECINNNGWLISDANTWLLGPETIIAIIFTIDMALHFVASGNLWASFLATPMTYINLLSVLPYYIQADTSDFTFSTADPGYLTFFKYVKVVRVIKLWTYLGPDGISMWRLLRHGGERLLIPTFSLGVIGLMASLLLYLGEAGTVCIVGEGCEDMVHYDVNMTQLQLTYKDGEKVLVGSMGSVSTFQDFRSSAWFSLATLTTVGYGDKIPTSSIGLLLASILLIITVLFFAVQVVSIGMVYQDVSAPSALRKEDPIILDSSSVKLLKSHEDIKVRPSRGR